MTTADSTDRARLTRRRFVEAAAVSLGALGAGGATSLSASAAKPPQTTTRYPLYVPPTVTLPRAGFTLTEAPARVDIGGGLSNVLAYNGTFPGPTLVASRGTTAAVQLRNGLTEETITHWHGMLVDEQNDGGPRYAIPAGATYDYIFTINQRACLNWYHPHPHMLTGKQVNLGLAGGFIVRDAEEAALGLPTGSHEVPLIVRDATLESGNVVYKPRTGGFDGQIPLVNGTRSPRLDVDRGVYRFRVLNGANARIFGLALSNGAPVTLIGNDGGFLESQSQQTRIDISPAERLDLLLSFAGLSVGQSVMLRDLRSGWDLLEFRVTQEGIPGTIPSLVLPTIDELANPVTTRTLSFDGMSKINGKLFEMERVDFQVPFGQVQRWRLITNGNAPHPVHIHGASFQVEARRGGRNQVFAWERGWKDTVLLEDRETVDILIRFDAYRGRYLVHCHKLEHEDMGMMATFEVI